MDLGEDPFILLKNSYVILIISFVVLSAIFYLLGIGHSISYESGVPTKKYGWKYPLAVSLVVWAIVHFYIYPSNNINHTQNESPISLTPEVRNISPPTIAQQRINMTNWT